MKDHALISAPASSKIFFARACAAVQTTVPESSKVAYVHQAVGIVSVPHAYALA